MRFISKYRRYKITARQEIKTALASGKDLVMQHPVICDFQWGIQVLPHEKELAKRSFKFRGIPVEEDEMTHLDPIYGPDPRLSVFDTEWPHLARQWAQWEQMEGKPAGTIRKEVEEFLTTYSQHGRDYLLVETIKVDMPYPRYDEHRKIHGQRKIEHAIKDIVAVYESAGFDIDQAIAYEKQEGDSPEVIAALEALRAPAPEEELIAA
jgi:hypothetical protein